MKLGIHLLRTRHPVWRAALLVSAVVFIGVIGFKMIGGSEVSLLDAAYMTIITLTTVGFAEVIPIHGNPAAQFFAIGLMMAGIGSFIFFFSNFTAFIVDGHLARWREARRVSRIVEGLNCHVIVCGLGETGAHVVQELIQTERPLVVIDSDPEVGDKLLELFDGRSIPWIVGDATDDDQLRGAGIERASGIIACAASDKDNLIIAITARMLNPDVRIVCRCVDQELAEKMMRVGANAVVSLQSIGGMRLVSELVRPTTVSFLDLMLKDSDHAFRVEAVEVHKGSTLDSSGIGELQERAIPELALVALSTGPKNWHYAPARDVVIRPGNELIVIATPQARRALERIAQDS